jgi:endoglucanase
MNKRWITATCVSAALISVGCGGAETEQSDERGITTVEDALSVARSTSAPTGFFVPQPDPGALKQVAALLQKRNLKGALQIASMISTPQAVWFTDGTPKQVEKAVKKVIAEAALERRIPVLVAYNVPYRDCAQYSAGGAADTAAYKAWIDGFAKGVGSAEATIILEPDALGIIPYNTTIYGAAEVCKPTVTGEDGTPVPAPGANPEQRYAQLQYAGAALAAYAPKASVYYDGTHSAWLGVGEAAYRINKATHDPLTGASLARGFFLNTSNYQTTAQAVQFGTWVSMCTAFATDPEEGGWRLGNFGWCASQYNPATGFSLDYSPEYAATVTAQIQGLMGTSVASLPFVIDTSRNGTGPLDESKYALAPYGQPETVLGALHNGSWCNPPGAGLGPRPTKAPAPLVDAYLWIKIPGESDGSCDIAGGARAWDYSLYNPWALSTAAQSHFDPLWGMVDPAAGAWFPEQALDLARNATPPLF